MSRRRGNDDRQCEANSKKQRTMDSFSKLLSQTYTLKAFLLHFLFQFSVIRKEVETSHEATTTAASSVAETNITQIPDPLDVENHSQSDWPDIWTEKQRKEFIGKHQWLFANSGKLGCRNCKEASINGLGPHKEKNVSLSEEWVNCEVGVSNDNEKRESKLSMLRGKIHKHVNSQAHVIAFKIVDSQKKDCISEAINKVKTEEVRKTEIVFRTAYFLAKKNRPFTDHPALIDLQTLNGLDCGIILHSRYSATEINDCIATEMKRKIIDNLVLSESKLSVIIDESTTLSNKSVLIIYLKTCVAQNNEKPDFLFLSLVELPSQTADVVTDTLMKTLSDSGLTEEFLHRNWLAFISDGASVMVGSRSGVATRLKTKFPNLFVWHCLNHRLELSVGDVLRDVTEINHFQNFMDSLYCVYSMSPKNQSQIKEASVELESELLKIGRVFSVRWIASSFRTVSAVWRSFKSLNRHFELAAEDASRDSKDRQQFRGLKAKLSSKEFLLDLALMHDCLSELSDLSLALQERDMTIPQAHKLLQRTIRVIASFNDSPGEKVLEAEKSVSGGVHQHVDLSTNKKIVSIKPKQFLQSLVDNMKARLVPTESDTFLKDLEVFDNKHLNTVNNDIRFGEAEVRRLAGRFQLDSKMCLRGMRAYVEGDKDDKEIRPLLKAIDTIPCSSAECERGFSQMNNIVTDHRSRLSLKNVHNLMFLNINGPPVGLFRPSSYVQKWLKGHHSSAINARSRRKAEESHTPKNFWDVL